MWPFRTDLECRQFVLDDSAHFHENLEAGPGSGIWFMFSSSLTPRLILHLSTEQRELTLPNVFLVEVAAFNTISVISDSKFSHQNTDLHKLFCLVEAYMTSGSYCSCCLWCLLECRVNGDNIAYWLRPVHSFRRWYLDPTWLHMGFLTSMLCVWTHYSCAFVSMLLFSVLYMTQCESVSTCAE